MPLMAAHEQDDARGAAWLLATTAQDCLRHPEKGRSYKAALINTYRLLEAYRSTELFGVGRLPSIHNQEPAETLAASEQLEHDASDVQKALDDSLVEVFKDSPREQAIDSIENVLRSIAYPESFPEKNETESEKAQEFLERFIVRLGA